MQLISFLLLAAVVAALGEEREVALVFDTNTFGVNIDYFQHGRTRHLLERLQGASLHLVTAISASTTTHVVYLSDHVTQGRGNSYSRSGLTETVVVANNLPVIFLELMCIDWVRGSPATTHAGVESYTVRWVGSADGILNDADWAYFISKVFPQNPATKQQGFPPSSVNTPAPNSLNWVLWTVITILVGLLMWNITVTRRNHQPHTEIATQTD